MKNLFITFLLVFLLSNIYAQKQVKYFDANWKETTKDSALYYRAIPAKVKTKTALGYKVKGIDSLYVIKDYYLKSGNMQFQGFSKDADATKLYGNVTWYDEMGEIIQNENYNYKHYSALGTAIKNYQPILTIEYQFVDRNILKAGTEFLLNGNDKDKLFLGIGYGMVNYQGKIFGIADYHLSLNGHNLYFFKIGGSQKHAYAMTGISFFNALDLGFGYSFPFSKTEIPYIKGFTVSLSFRLTNNNNAYVPLHIAW